MLVTLVLCILLIITIIFILVLHTKKTKIFAAIRGSAEIRVKLGYIDLVFTK